jgi:opacity protein-like surface antigen
MKKIVLTSVLAFAVLHTTIYAGGDIVPAPILEDETPSAWYMGAGLVWAKFNTCGGGCNYEDATYGGMIRGGYDINEYFGIEARGIKTFLDEGPYGGAPLQHVGIYAKPQYPVNERVNVYLLLGYGYTENLGNGERLNYFESDNGFAAGIGFEYDLSDRDDDFDEAYTYDREFDGYADQGRGWSFFIDYERMLLKSDIPDMDAVSIGIRYDF